MGHAGDPSPPPASRVPHPSSLLKTLGVTGGIGSGKSALVAWLAEHDGVRAVLADDLAKRLMAEDPEVRRQLVERFGAETFDATGALDRGALARRVFGDPAELAALNAIVHPAVRRALTEAIDQARADGVALLVYEAALLFETDGDAVLDRTVWVDAPVETRVVRAMARDGATEESVRARMRHQLDPEAGRQRADVVVDNSGDLFALWAAADALAEELGAGPRPGGATAPA